MNGEITNAREEEYLPNILAEAVGISDLMVKHRYLQDLCRGDVVPLDPAEIYEKPGRIVRLFQISSMTYESGADVLERFGSVFSAIARYHASALYILRFDGGYVHLYLGVGCLEKADLSMVYDTFKGAFDGNFSGCRDLRLNNDENDSLISDLFDYEQDDRISVASVSGILEAVGREDDVRQHGLERLIDGMRGERFDLVILADAVKSDVVSGMRDSFERLNSQLSPFREQTISMNRGETASYAETLGSSISETITHTTGVSSNWGSNWSKSVNTGTSQNEPTAKNRAIAIGSTVLAVAGAGALAAGGFLGEAVSVGSAMMSGAFMGEPLSRVLGAALDERRVNSSDSEAASEGGQQGGGEHQDVSQGKSSTQSWNLSETLAQSISQTCQYTFKNRAIENMMETIDQRIDHLKHCESGGAFSCAAYILAADNSVANRAASLYKSALMGMGGKESSVYINVWDQPQDTWNICRALRQLQHPRINMKEFPDVISRVVPSTLVSAKDMPRYFMLPRESLTGVMVQEHARFARDILVRPDEERIHIGNLYHMGIEDKMVPVDLGVQSLTMHAFVTGTTGMGKSTVIYNLLSSLRAMGVKFMVIEPVKGEYKNEFGNMPDVHVYGTNEAYTPLLRINPFRFPRGIHVLEHMDGLIEILTVCWPLYAAMPAVLKKAVERAYEMAGWDLKRSRNRYAENIYPTFKDVMDQTHKVLEESQYSGENKGNYIGALCMRLEKLTTGIEGMIFTADDLSDEALFDENVIVDISRVQSGELKSLIMGMLVLKLKEHRQCTACGANQALKHVTVLEEAHNLMRKNPVQASGDGSAIAGKSVEMISNAIAEIRSYGEGFIIADQAPGELDESVIRNTNTKIVMCLPKTEDRVPTGQSMGMREDQIQELARLNRGVAAVYQNDWPEAVLVRLPRFTGGAGMYVLPDAQEAVACDLEELKYAVAANRLDDFISGLQGAGMQAFLRSEAPTEFKCSILEYMKADAKTRPSVWSRAVYALFGSPDALEKAASAKTIVQWRSDTLARLNLPEGRYTDQEIDILMAALIREQALRDERCNRLCFDYMNSIRHRQ